MNKAEDFYNEIWGSSELAEGGSQKKAVTIRLDFPVIAKIDAFCALGHMSRNEVLSNLVNIATDAVLSHGDSDNAAAFHEKYEEEMRDLLEQEGLLS